MLRRLRLVLRPPGAPALVALSLLARLPMGVAPVALLLLLERSTGSFAAGAAVTSLVAVGSGLLGPLRGRLLDRYGVATLHVFAVANAAGTLALAALAGSAPLGLLAALGALQGATSPPVPAAMRDAWRRMHGAGTPELASAYAFEMSAHIAVFVVGPLLASAGLATVGPRATLMTAAALTAAAGVLFAARVGLEPAETSSRVRGLGAIGLPAVRRLVLVTALADLALGVVDVAAVALASERGRPELGGAFLALFALGAVVGGLLHGARTWRAPARRRLVAILGAFAVALLALAAGPPLVLVPVVLLLAGMPSAAQWATTTVVLDEVAGAAGAEAFGWLSSANAAGIALGGVAAGWLADAHGTSAAFAVAAVTAGAACVVALASPSLGPAEAGPRWPLWGRIRRWPSAT